MRRGGGSPAGRTAAAPVPRLGALPEAELAVGAGEDELVEEVGLPAADGAFGHDAARHGAVEDLQVYPDRALVPHPGRGRALVGGVGAGGGGHAAHAVAGEQSHPHVGVAGPAERGVVPALVLKGRRRTTAAGWRTKEELRSTRRRASVGSR